MKVKYVYIVVLIIVDEYIDVVCVELDVVYFFIVGNELCFGC